MKKITLFAVAALSVSSAFAVEPNEAQISQPIKLQRSAKAVKQVESVTVPTTQISQFGLVRSAIASSRAAEDAGVISYTTNDVLYSATTVNGYGWTKSYGFAPAFNDVEFYPLFEADSYNWAWNYRNEEATTSTDTVLTIPVEMRRFFEPPVLTFKTGDKEYSYVNEDIAELISGATPAAVGLIHKVDNEPALLSPAIFQGITGNIVPVIDYTGDYAQNFNAETGTYVNIGKSLGKRFADVTDIKLVGYGAILPGLKSVYTVGGGTIYIQADNTEPQELTITAHPIVDNTIIKNDTIGLGSIFVPVGEADQTGANFFNGFASFELYEVDELNLSTGAPLSVTGEGVYLSITGVNDKDKFTSFSLCYNEVTMPVSYVTDENESANYYAVIDANPFNAYLEVEGTTADGKPTSGIGVNNSFFYTNDALTEVMLSCEYTIFYDVNFPFVANYTQGYEKDDLSIEIPVDGPGSNRFFYTTMDMAQLISDGYVVEEKDGDWFDYELIPDEEESSIFEIVVAAEALPEGVEGRTGSIHFTGYGYDFEIEVFQGDKNASISSIVANKAAQGKVFDLQGRAVKNATKGIFIVDGKKTILK